MTILFLGILALTIIIGIPIGFAVALTSFLFLWINDFPNLGIIAQRMISGVDSFPILALPFFILAGDLMSYGTTQRLMRLANVFLGRIRGGLAVSGVAASAFFGAISGSGAATAAAVGSLIEPEMVKKGYSKAFTASIMAGAGALGIVIPPSLAMVVYGVAAGVSIGDLFLAGIIPGLLSSLLLMVYAVWKSKKKNIPINDEEITWSEKLDTIKDGFLPLLMPFIIMGGVMSGIFTPTESAVVAVVYAFILAVFVYKQLKIKDLIKVTYNSAKNSAVILFIIAAATPFGWIMSIEQIPQTIADWMLSIAPTDLILLLLVVVFILFLGTFMETIAIIIILTPILLPIVNELGIDPVHFGVVLMIGLVIGGATPPLAVNLFITSKIVNIQIEDTFPDILEVVGVLLIALLIVLFLPILSLWIPSIVG